MRVTRFQTSGSVPEPMWVCSRVIFRSWRSASAFTSPRYSCQMPKLEAGPPVFVRLVEPLPSPGFIRTETSRPARPGRSASSWCSEQALKSTPLPRNSAQPARRHLRGQLDLRRREAGAQRALDLEVAGGVDVQAERAEQLQDAEARVGLHRVAQREAERRRERQRLAGGGLERRAVVDVAGRAEALAHLGGAGGRELSAGRHALRYAASTASAIWRVVAAPPWSGVSVLPSR